MGRDRRRCCLPDGQTVTAVTLRKRFERLKTKLARLAREEGLLE